MGIYNRCNRCNPKYRAPPKKELSMEGQKPGYKSYKKACSSMFFVRRDGPLRTRGT